MSVDGLEKIQTVILMLRNNLFSAAEHHSDKKGNVIID